MTKKNNCGKLFDIFCISVRNMQRAKTRAAQRQWEICRELRRGLLNVSLRSNDSGAPSLGFEQRPLAKNSIFWLNEKSGRRPKSDRVRSTSDWRRCMAHFCRRLAAWLSSGRFQSKRRLHSTSWSRDISIQTDQFSQENLPSTILTVCVSLQFRKCNKKWVTWRQQWRGLHVHAGPWMIKLMKRHSTY